MIGNITKGNGFYGCVAYVLGKENAQLINSNMASTTPTDLAWEFRKFAQLNQRVEKPVLHISLSPAPGDRILDEWELCMIAQDLLEGLELSFNQFMLVQHNDAEYEGKVRPHIHLVINRVSVNGKCNDDYLDYYRTEKLLRQIEKTYNLIPQPSSWEVEKKKAYPKHVEKAAGELNIVERLQNAIERAAVDKPEMPVFVARLLKDNIQANCRFTRTGKLKGISYCMEGEAFKGGDLGKLYTHVGIREHLGVGYQQSYSEPINSLMESYKRGRTINDEWVEHLSYWCLRRNEESDVLISKPEEIEYSNNESAPQKIQSLVVTPVRLEKEIEQPIIPETPAIPTSDDVDTEIVTNNNNNSDSTNESITDNTSVVEPAPSCYKSVVPSVESVFGTPLSNKAKKQLSNKAKSNNKETSFRDRNTDVAPPQKSYVLVVPSIESVFPSPKDSEEKEREKNIIQADTSIESQPISIPSEEAIEPAIEPEAAIYAVIIAGYMANQNTLEIKGETLHASLSSDATELTVQRYDSNETILSGYYSPSDGGWVITDSKKFTSEEKKRIIQLKKRTNTLLQQPNKSVEGFEQ
ncbi:MAG: relaxase/mobilization nuclease domain-containing protein [Richelia sp. RM2_1_2]|nr:relaxase/mobilization nuclease domain-containing protein [Richelia sp. SM1_7_0]NJN12188.1 relaxase/mobilization nuclease domain-containing protein [Richelia sp. RM1_1_1]NJO30714.1 relaxase/mobilization nuclease domain-containing protein [Richelia sp. SL_2_1]NJO63210.1 relaxase/mobilization nuclease domain-containing protein [Richelia sp. RM2_1_2]